jgi:hypothetical protein
VTSKKTEIPKRDMWHRVSIYLVGTLVLAGLAILVDGWEHRQPGPDGFALVMFAGLLGLLALAFGAHVFLGRSRLRRWELATFLASAGLAGAPLAVLAVALWFGALGIGGGTAATCAIGAATSFATSGAAYLPRGGRPLTEGQRVVRRRVGWTLLAAAGAICLAR